MAVPSPRWALCLFLLFLACEPSLSQLAQVDHGAAALAQTSAQTGTRVQAIDHDGILAKHYASARNILCVPAVLLAAMIMMPTVINLVSAEDCKEELMQIPAPFEVTTRQSQHKDIFGASYAWPDDWSPVLLSYDVNLPRKSVPDVKVVSGDELFSNASFADTDQGQALLQQESTSTVIPDEEIQSDLPPPVHVEIRPYNRVTRGHSGIIGIMVHDDEEDLSGFKSHGDQSVLITEQDILVGIDCQPILETRHTINAILDPETYLEEAGKHGSIVSKVTFRTFHHPVMLEFLSLHEGYKLDLCAHTGVNGDDYMTYELEGSCPEDDVIDGDQVKQWLHDTKQQQKDACLKCWENDKWPHTDEGRDNMHLRRTGSVANSVYGIVVYCVTLICVFLLSWYPFRSDVNNDTDFEKDEKVSFLQGVLLAFLDKRGSEGYTTLTFLMWMCGDILWAFFVSLLVLSVEKLFRVKSFRRFLVKVFGSKFSRVELYLATSISAIAIATATVMPARQFILGKNLDARYNSMLEDFAFISTWIAHSLNLLFLFDALIKYCNVFLGMRMHPLASDESAGLILGVAAAFDSVNGMSSLSREAHGHGSACSLATLSQSFHRIRDTGAFDNAELELSCTESAADFEMVMNMTANHPTTGKPTNVTLLEADELDDGSVCTLTCTRYSEKFKKDKVKSNPILCKPSGWLGTHWTLNENEEDLGGKLCHVDQPTTGKNSTTSTTGKNSTM